MKRTKRIISIVLAMFLISVTPLVSAAAVNWNYPSGMSVEVYGAGSYNNPMRVNIPNPGNVHHCSGNGF